MMKRLITAFFLISSSACLLFAQNEQQQINEIKSNIDFLYATGTSTASAEDASGIAKDLLSIEIEQWLKENVTEDVAGYVAKSGENLSLIETRRGSLYRVFAYVKKKEILPYYEEENVMVVQIKKPDEAEKVAEVEEVKVVEEVKAIEDVILDEATVEIEEVMEPDTTGVVVEQVEEAPVEPAYVPSGVESEMLKVGTFNALNDYINKGREDGSIIGLGKYSDLPRTGIVYVFIHNRQGEIPACMKVTDGQCVNMSTGKSDEITNYKGCGAIWIKIKQ